MNTRMFTYAHAVHKIENQDFACLMERVGHTTQLKGELKGDTTGDPTPTFQWQVSTNDGSTWAVVLKDNETGSPMKVAYILSF